LNVKILFFFLALLITTLLYSQNKYSYTPWKIDTLFVVKKETRSLKLPDSHRIQQQSLNILLNYNSVYEHQNYQFNSNTNIVSFFIPLAAGDTIQLQYQVLPVFLKKNYQFLTLDTLKSDTSKTDSIRIIKKTPKNPFANIGGGLKKSGSIVRGVKIGNNRDLTLNSGLNLQLSGQLTDDVEIVAALTDESTPIQPEGNTQTLQEVDKVFIDFKSPWIKGTLGDFNLQYMNSRFADISRKLQGITLLGNYKSYQLGATVGTTRGFFHHLSFIGKEANQGPYQLTGKNGESEIIVLAGTERIWINGEKLIRGENNDYIIEYGNGQVTFTNRRLITGESRIEIDFEYYPALQKYSRNVYSGLTTGNLGDNRFNFVVKYYREEDDPERLLEEEGILSDQEKSILENAGDEQLNAYTSSSVYVGDSLGYYVRIDTILNSENYSIYRFVGKNKGNYNVSFSSVGGGNGDYSRDRLGEYKWVGIKKGTYLPIKLLPLPSQQQLADIQFEFKPTDKISVKSEYAISAFDKNRYSTIDDKDNTGQAMQLSATTKPLMLNLFNSKFGEIDFSTTGRFIESDFNPVDRINQPDFRKYWNVLGNEQTSSEEKSFEFNSGYKPVKWINIFGNIGFMNREKFKSVRYKGALDWNKENWFRGNASQEYVNSEQEAIKNKWLRQQVHLEKDIILFQPGITIDHEKRKNTNLSRIGGFDFVDITGRVGLINHQLLSGYILYSHREDDIFDPDQQGKQIKQSDTQTRRFRVDLAEWNNTSGSLEVVNRKKNYTSFVENIKVDSLKLQYADAQLQDTVWQDRETNLAELTLNNHQWNHALDVSWQYRVSTEQLALREKIYIDVGEGRGNLRYDEDLNEYLPDPDGQYILFIIPSGKFQPVTNLESSLRLQLDADKYWKKPKTGLQKVLSALNSESFFRVEEETKEKNIQQIYLLNLSKFQGDSTLQGSKVFNEDLYIMRRNRDISFRLRYRYRDSKSNQYLDENENEDRLTIERGVRASYKVINNVKAQTEFRQQFTYRNSQANSSRNRDINSNILDQNFSYRPNLEWEFGIDSEFGFEKDLIPTRDLNLRYTKLLSRINYSLLKKGRITAEYEYIDVTAVNNPNKLVVPFEMALGKKEGVSKRWQLRGDYTVAENVIFTLFYSGRDDANYEKVIHTGQAEVRAYF